ncbi:enoyl-CoA hydratase/isomerase family protein [Halopiger goleimassiliensis]|uniref:enoyl-CoA hydratase/isomerase family protein n=1 Tax=Halopiger goleimassiliensis TaxID=1293048 RepID=UPI0006782B4A|nr:enoyl-CoA hydratase/isomerase family protein [Halopiger goleimassiliensis]
MASAELVDLEITNGVAIVRLNRPESLNAVTLELLSDLRDALVDLPEDDIGGLVITGAGEVTCAGMDREIVADPAYDEKFADDIDALTAEVYDVLSSRSYPTAVAARGALVGIGFILSLRCDFLVVGEETTLSMPEVQFGIAATEAVPYLEAIVGTRPAKEIALTGDALPPERARELGLANRVVPESEVEATTRELVEEIAAHDPDAVGRLKAAMGDPMA